MRLCKVPLNSSHLTRPARNKHTATCIIIAPKRLKLRLSGSARTSQKRFRDTPRFKFQAVWPRTQPFLSRSVEKRGDQSRFKCRKMINYYAIRSRTQRAHRCVKAHLSLRPDQAANSDDSQPRSDSRGREPVVHCRGLQRHAATAAAGTEARPAVQVKLIPQPCDEKRTFLFTCFLHDDPCPGRGWLGK